jgi:hypothetical protein
LEEAAKVCAEYFLKEMTLNGWVGKALEVKRVNISKATDDDVHRILLRTIIQLYDTWEEDIEFEKGEEEEDEEEDENDEEIEDGDNKDDSDDFEYR